MAENRLSIVMALVALAVSGHAADTFLSASPRVSTEHVRQSLLAELGSRANPGRLGQLQDELRPMFAALPKGEHGNLEPAVVRYAAHRYFVHRHGWHMKGLEPSAGVRNTSSAASINAYMVPTYIQGIFEEYLGKRGFSLQDLAIFMATIEDLVNEDRLGELLSSYRLHGFPTEDHLTSNMVDEALNSYMSSYILGMNLSNMTLQDLKGQDMEEIYPGWGETVSWVKDVRQSVDFKDRNHRNPFVANTIDLKGAERVIDEIGDRYGSFQDLECRSLKEALLALEHQDTGRVRLADFYRKGLGGDWQFTESAAYLRELGALDESDPKRPSVLVPNYIGGQSNCLVSTSFYTVCCMDECEGLLGQLERELAEPLVEPARIAAVVSALPSDTVHAPRNLSVDLLRRLDEIAEHHEGHVPLHGRLFAQWMHHAYPRECPFPHVSGTTSPMTQELWAETYGVDNLEATEGEKRSHMASVAGDLGHRSVEVPWMAVEELVAPHRHARVLARSSFTTFSWKALLFAAPVSFALHLVRRAVSASSASSTNTEPLAGKAHFV